MDTENINLQTESEGKSLTDAELLEKYNAAEEDSEDFARIKAELAERGYVFEAEDEAGNAVADIQPAAPQKAPYGITCTMAWELVYLVIALAGGIYFLVTMEQNEVHITTRIAITTSLAVLFVVSLGMLAGAVRRLANQKYLNDLQHNPIAYYVLSGLWSVTALGALYYGIRMFADIVKFSFKYALMSATMPLAGVMVCIAFAGFFWVMGREAKA